MTWRMLSIAPHISAVLAWLQLIHIYSMMDDFWIRNILLIEYICVFLVNSQNNSMHARFQNMRSDWKYTYWKDGHFLNAEILNSENWLKIHIHSKSTWSFGPLSSFGPVMVIRTPIRKDPRADSLNGNTSFRRPLLLLLLPICRESERDLLRSICYYRT